MFVRLPLQLRADREGIGMRVVAVDTRRAGHEIPADLVALAVEVGEEEHHAGSDAVSAADGEALVRFRPRDRRGDAAVRIDAQAGRPITRHLGLEPACADYERASGVLSADQPSDRVLAA